MTSRTQVISYGGSVSSVGMVKSGVPQGLVLGPILFTMYTSDIFAIVKSHGFNVHAFADDIQIMGSCKPELVQEVVDKLIV